MTHQPVVHRREFVTAAASSVLAGGPLLALTEGASQRLSRLNVDDFAARLGSQFLLRDESGRVFRAELVEAKVCRYRPGPGFRQGFSVVFRLLEDQRLAQNVYHVLHASVGTFRQLLVPIGPSSKYEFMEAVFG